MPNYGLSANQRGYAKVESSFGTVPVFAATDAFRFISLQTGLEQQYIERRDKLGSRTFAGVVAGGRRKGSCSVEAHLIPRGSAGVAPDMDPFFHAAMGGTPLAFAGGTAAASCTTSSIVFQAAHGLAVGQAIGFNGELRFVTVVDSATAVTIDPPFTDAPGAGDPITGTVSYPLATDLPSLSIMSRWDPDTMEQHIVAGWVANRMRLAVNGDTHDVSFEGEAQDLIDSVTIDSDQGGLAGSFPTEPASPSYSGVPIAGHYGQAWLGASLSQYSTVLSATVQLENNVQLREREFGYRVPQGHAALVRGITWDMEFYEQDSATMQAIRTAARNRTAIKAFLQLGAFAGQIFGVYAPAIVPQVPQKADDEANVKLSTSGSRAQSSTANKELYVAFG